MRLKLVKCEYINDWYIIQREVHDGKSWYEQIGENSFRMMSSERLSPEACIEGDCWEMKTIANAIDNFSSVSHKRVAVEFSGDGFNFWSPKNSKHKTHINIEDSLDLASQIGFMIEDL